MKRDCSHEEVNEFCLTRCADGGAYEHYGKHYCGTHYLAIISGQEERDRKAADYERLQTENERLTALLNTPETESFDKAVPLEAAHQIERWAAAHDAGKNPEDWFWLVGYLAGKALAAMKAGNAEKAKHHCISTAAALRNWHAHIRSGSSAMRPGIGEEKQAVRGDSDVSV